MTILQVAATGSSRLPNSTTSIVIHVNGYAHARLDMDRPVLVVAHSDVFSWWHAVHKHSPPPEWERYRDRAVAGLAAATCIVAPTAAVLHDLEHHYGLLGRKTEVLPNGIELTGFAALPKAPLVLAVGRIWDAAKNLAILETIAPDLAWPVEIAGEVEHPEGGAERYSNVRLLGRLSAVEMARRLDRASIFVAPARYEPFGLAILEAAAAGCALVLGDIPSLRENWDGAAVFVDPEESTGAQIRHQRSHRQSEEKKPCSGSSAVPSAGIHVVSYGARLRGALPRDGADFGPSGECVMPKLVLFCHSLRSDWNHGNAHFLRGVMSECWLRGFDVLALEPRESWSAENLSRDHGPSALEAWREVYPSLPLQVYDLAQLDLDRALDGADLVLVHEWNEPELVARIAVHRNCGGSYLLLFHDTHHRMVSAPDAIGRLDFEGFDGVLVFGEVLREAYRRRGWARQVFTWHEAADLRVFGHLAGVPRQRDLVWIGNWGDDERTAELREFFIEPVVALGLSARVHGVRYPHSGARDTGPRPVSNSRDTFPISGFPIALRQPRQRSTSRAALTSACCRGSRRSGYSKHLPAAFHWFRRPGKTVRGCLPRAKIF